MIDREVNLVANIKSAIKRVKTAEASRVRNAMAKSFLKTTVKKSKEAIAKADASAKDLAKKAIKAIDRAVSKGVLHKNTAARKKSKLAKAMNVSNVK
jgi:small subunit ribosomal protein S20